MTRKINWIVAEALALVVIAGSSTVATSALAEEPLTGPALEKASAAALEHLGGGTVVETEAGENGTPYQVEVRLEDGCTVEVALDANFKVIGEPAGEESVDDEEGASDQDEPGEEEGDQGTQCKSTPAIRYPAELSILGPLSTFAHQRAERGVSRRSTSPRTDLHACNSKAYCYRRGVLPDAS